MLSLIEFLRQVPLLEELSEQDLVEIADESTVVELAHGELLFSEGTVGDAAYVVQSGRIEILKQSHGREVLLDALVAGDLFGEMALLDNSTRMAGARASGATTVIAIRKSQFDNLMKTSLPVVNAMFSLVIDRLKSTEARLRQTERMAQLGTLTAGVAHELNNPAAAAKRAADQLSEALEGFGKANREFVALNPGPDSVVAAMQVIENARSRAANTPEIDLLDQSDLEDEIVSWLDDREVADSWDLSCELASAGYSRDDLDQLAKQFEGGDAGPLVNLIASTVSVTALLSSVGQTTGQISNIVNALKSYSFLDQAPVQQVSVTEGIDNTLLLLGGRLTSGVVVTLDYEDDLPKIDAFGSELNQVWTHLIDNSLDAINGNGDLRISVTASPNAGVTVEIEDSGPGIPAEDQHRIFDAFFTTKEPGKGAGLGLHSAYNIVVNKHGGEISVESVSGRTCFTVRLPSQQDS